MITAHKEPIYAIHEVEPNRYEIYVSRYQDDMKNEAVWERFSAHYSQLNDAVTALQLHDQKNKFKARVVYKGTADKIIKDHNGGK